MPPINEGVCDHCGGDLIQRKDDEPEVINKRWEVFMDNARSVLDFYGKKGKLIKIEGTGNKNEVFKRVREKINA